MAKSNKQLVNLAKGGVKKAAPVEEVKVQEVELTKEEKRELKAKETVKELLSDSEVDLTLTEKPKEEELLEVVPDTGNTEWLQEQIALLASENQNLKNEMEVMKIDYQKMLNENLRIKEGSGLQNDGELKNGILTVFHELQSNYMKMGFNQVPRQEIVPAGEPNFRIAPAAFINRLIMYFPFLKDQKRF
jgi:hypothetical protein